MRLYRAETGKRVQIPQLRPNDGLDTLRAAIEKATRIPQGSQILMTDTGLQLKPDMMFEAITSSGKDEYTIMVYNREVLTTDISSSILTLKEQAKTEPMVQPLSPTLLQPIVIPSRPASPSANRDWGSQFQRMFEAYIAHVLAYYRVIVAHAGICERIMEELRMQSLAVQVALTNLDAHSQSVLETFEKFNAFATKELTKQARLLQSFPRDIEALRQIRVHPALLPPDSPDRYISDFIPTDKLVLWAERCRDIHEGLLRDGKDLSRSIKEVQEGTVAIRSNSGINLEQLEDAMTEILQTVEQQSQIRQRVERDQTRVRERLAEISKPSTFSSSGPTLEALGQLANVYTTDYMEAAQRADEMLRNKLGIFIAAKRSQTANLISQLMHISKLQSTIASIPPSLGNLDDSLRKRDADFSQLVYVQRIPIAYGALIVEIVRRREYSKLLLQKSQQLAEVMSRFRKLEQRRRDSFRSEVAKFVPVVVPGLDDVPPFSEINALNTKDQLPPFTREHVAEFERLISQLSTGPGQEGSVEHSLGVESNPGASSISSQESNQDALSKLRVTLVKMTTQMDVMGGEFDRILEKSFYTERIQRLEEENSRLRADMSRIDIQQRSGTPQLGQHPFPRLSTPVGTASVGAGSTAAAVGVSVNTPTSPKLTRQPSRSGSANTSRVESDEHQQVIQQQIQQNQKLTKENTDLGTKIKAYEARIRSLEETIYQNFRAASSAESPISSKDSRQQSTITGSDQPWKTPEDIQHARSLSQATENERKQAEERLVTLEQEIQDVSLKLEQTEEKLKKEVIVSQQTATANDELRQEVLELKLQSATLEEASVLRAFDHSGIQKRSEELEEELKGMTQKYDHLLERHEKETETQALEIIAFKDRLEDINKQHSIEKEILDGQLEQAQRTADETAEHVIELENELIVVNEELQNKVLELEEQLESHAAEHEEVTARAQEQERQLASHRAVHNDILVQLNDHKQNAAETQEALNKTKELYTTLQEAHAKLEADQKILQRDANETNKSKDALAQQIADLQKQVSELEAQREAYNVGFNMRLEEAKTMLKRAEEGWKEKSRLLEQSERATKDLEQPIMECMTSLGHERVSVEVISLGQVRDMLQEIGRDIQQLVMRQTKERTESQKAHDEAVSTLKQGYESSKDIRETTIASLNKVRRDAEAETVAVKQESEAAINQLKNELESIRVQQRASSIPVPVSTTPISGTPLTSTSPITPMPPTLPTATKLALSKDGDQFNVQDRILLGTLALDLGIPLPLLSEVDDQDVVLPTSSVLLDHSERRQKSSSTIMAPAPVQGGSSSTPTVGSSSRSSSTTVPLSTDVLQTLDFSDLDITKATALIKKKLFDTEHLLKRWQRECKSLKEKYNRASTEAHDKIAFRNFKVDDLTLFLPTRNSVSKPWAAFNINFPHYFLQMTPTMANQLRNREWIVARITSITEAIVDKRQVASTTDAEDDSGAGSSITPHNPFGLADGVKYYLLEATSWSGHSHGHGHGKSASSHYSSTGGSSSSKLRHHSSTSALGESPSSSSRRDADRNREQRDRDQPFDRRKHRDSQGGLEEERSIITATASKPAPAPSATVQETRSDVSSTSTSLPPSGPPPTAILSASGISQRNSLGASGTLPISIPYQSPATNALRAISGSVGSTGSGGSGSISSLLSHHLGGGSASGTGAAMAASSPPRTMLLSSSPHKTGISPVVATGTTVSINHSSATGHSASHSMSHSQGGSSSVGGGSPNLGSSATGVFGISSISSMSNMPIHPSRLSMSSNRGDMLEQLAVFATDEDQELDRKEEERKRIAIAR
ncbi:oligomeric, coiled-coil, peripheral membrane protein [Podila minutissima]|uniref:Autophagy-related protein 11 n=1 Tax=Podila minutissima TaxID=64525 RepID=A0A9P5SQS3_9FUNG|nr:oligomeric, coiled-coil, peripheral membrane protein [Podila minutissima]